MATRRSPIPVPPDPVLSGLGELVNGETVARAIRERLPAAGESATAKYIRYKPANKAIILFEGAYEGVSAPFVGTVAALRDLRRFARRSSTREIAERARPRCAVSTPIMYLEELDLLVEWYPASTKIPGLAFDAKELRQLLAREGRDPGARKRIRLAVYKPERRAVMQWGNCYIRAYARSQDYLQAVRNGQMAGLLGIVTPLPVCRFDDAMTLVQTEIPGSPFDKVHDAPVLGVLLKKFHGRSGLELSAFTPGDHLDVVRRTVDHLCHLLPELSQRVRSLLGELERFPPKDILLVPSHGDLHPGQVLMSDEGPALLDFDHMAFAHPADDLATFAAHGVAGSQGSFDSARRDLLALLEGYGRPPDHLPWYLAGAILRRAAFPFRFLDSQWPARVREFVSAAESACALRLPTVC